MQPPRGFTQQPIRCLNRVLFEPEEVSSVGKVVTLPAEDYRVVHIRQVLNLGARGIAEPDKVSASSFLPCQNMLV